ncbi:hypothetical protein DID78_02375 [Candidatus Marinamargulisbacteria bacterium SCGC AG-343-D04]|nr:hypothetical protein DID78_02375 [Candidatus Marinamargulisbacteria bacterium SCGC AG-343-D04]
MRYFKITSLCLIAVILVGTMLWREIQVFSSDYYFSYPVQESVFQYLIHEEIQEESIVNHPKMTLTIVDKWIINQAEIIVLSGTPEEKDLLAYVSKKKKKYVKQATTLSHSRLIEYKGDMRGWVSEEGRLDYVQEMYTVCTSLFPERKNQIKIRFYELVLSQKT